MQFVREEFLHGAFWQLFTSQLVHLNSQHALINYLCLALSLMYLSGRTGLSYAFLSLLAGSLGVALILVWDVDCQYYAGLSGALYGLWSGCCVKMLLGKNACKIRLEGAVILIFIASKLLFRDSDVLFYLNDIQVYHPAHEYGAFGGVLFGLIPFLRNIQFSQQKDN